ncbi:MAG TPA: DUF6223 family protein [Amycolatopsis sp.]|uniref:DUF6223 family protein n=1 Tax=Amycolatopsis sp. TaxID=37632 RepID=UPI002B49BFDE|nr:DUF6223 family protein [Amycolatopsis sp.]HKS50087.1 DUF6223 family protein [Amycolatopsis sp.]
MALVAGLTGVVNGKLVLATADGGPGTGNGVAGGALVLVLCWSARSSVGWLWPAPAAPG